MNRPWTAREVEQLTQLYPEHATSQIAEALNRSVPAIYRMAKKLGLNKSQAFFDNPELSGRTDGKKGISGRFQKGHVPANKGKSRPTTGRTAETQFKPGHKPHNWAPIGSERIRSDGYRERKMTDTGYPPRDWVCIHTMLWKEQQGPIPTGHVLIFRDGDKTNIVIDNLKLISRKELARRNSIHNLPEPLRETIRAKGVLTRKINQHEKQNRRSSGSSVRDH